MFDIGWSELLILCVVILIVVGPKELPVFLRTLGRYVGVVKRQAGEFRAHFDEAMRASELRELRDEMRDLQDDVQDTFRQTDTANAADPSTVATSASPENAPGSDGDATAASGEGDNAPDTKRVQQGEA